MILLRAADGGNDVNDNDVNDDHNDDEDLRSALASPVVSECFLFSPSHDDAMFDFKLG